jgi:hypothetical protein
VALGAFTDLTAGSGGGRPGPAGVLPGNSDGRSWDRLIVSWNVEPAEGLVFRSSPGIRGRWYDFYRLGDWSLGA